MSNLGWIGDVAVTDFLVSHWAEEMSEGIEIPWTALSPAALTGLVEAFVLQEGTDYGHSEYSLEEKVASVRAQLSSGKAYISFDPDTETAVIIARES